MNKLGGIYELKDEAIVKPERYLGGNVGEFQLPDEYGSTAWYTSARDYLEETLVTVNNTLKKEGKALTTGKQAERPYPEKYRPETDISPELDGELMTRYQQYIGILRWAVELGRVDILVEVSKLSSFNCMPRVGHLEAVYNIFAYLQKHLRSKIVFDPTYPIINEDEFTKADWKDFYGGVVEETPTNCPEPRGNEVIMSMFADADHAGNLLTRRSHTGLLIFLNNALVDWYSKGQATVESSTFGSESVALRTGIDKIQALRYKLHMMGVPICGAANIYCDNKTVCNTAQKPEARLTKKHNAINFHRIREAVAAGWCRVAHEAGKTNLADLLTKILPTYKRREFLGILTY